MAFAALSGFGVKSFWAVNVMDFGRFHYLVLHRGVIEYQHLSGKFYDKMNDEVQIASTDAGPASAASVLDFSVTSLFDKLSGTGVFDVRARLWLLLLLLMIAPVSWLIGRPENGPAFPVINDL